MTNTLGISENQIALYTNTAKELKGSPRRVFMARVAENIGRGGKIFAEKILGWNRKTINKGMQELKNEPIMDLRKNSGRKPAEHHNPNLLIDIKNIADPFTQTEPTFANLKMYTRVTAKTVLKNLDVHFNHSKYFLPSLRTINTKLRDLGFLPRKIKKSKPLKKIPEVNEIFANIKITNSDALKDPNTLYISVDAKAVIKLGDFSRGGYSRTNVQAIDHDFPFGAKITPFGALLPGSGKSYIWLTGGSCTADFMIDCIENLVEIELKIKAFKRLVINLDNGPENNSHRTQWIKRIVELSQKFNIKIQLAYYPPYHSKYNRVERLWGVLERYWEGELLNSLEKIISLAEEMTFKKINPIVSFVKKVYEKGVTLTKNEMKEIEKKIVRMPSLPKWFVQIG